MLPFSAHLGYLFNEVPLEARFAAAAAAGFGAVEHPNPYDIPAKELAALIRSHGLRFVQFASPAGDAARGEKGCAALPGREAEFRDGIELALTYARDAGIRLVQVQSGLVIPGADPAEMWSTYVDNLRLAARRAAARGIAVLIEPIGASTIEGYYMSTTDLALRALDEIGEPNVALLFDAFHSTVAGEDPVAVIRANARRIRHLHIADHPGRHEPGTGFIDFVRLFGAIEAAGYDGFIGCEYKPAGRTEDGLGWMRSITGKKE